MKNPNCFFLGFFPWVLGCGIYFVDAMMSIFIIQSRRLPIIYYGHKVAGVILLPFCLSHFGSVLSVNEIIYKHTSLLCLLCVTILYIYIFKL